MRLGIAGIGLIGGSIALRASANGLAVTGWDPEPAHVAFGRAHGMLAEAARSFDELADGVDALVLAGPLEATLVQLARLRERPSRAFPILDTASVKGPVSRAADGLAAFVASHPIAGSERSGPAAARADLFADRVWTIDADAAPAAKTAARALLGGFGAHVVELGSDEHDRTIALTSHLPQLVSVALGAQLAERLDAATLALCGTGMRSLLRLGTSSWTLWRAVLAANSVSVAQEVRRLAAILSDAAEALETDRIDALAPRFSAAATAVARLEPRAERPAGKGPS